ncbi:V-type proton ATPase subunit F-like [Lathamus discolor]|uniref:V-type proton ATPase subunit F-like n=1 Tax=Lathamus discolor TaxID=678569 RepID=UPI0032B7E301
MVTGLLLGGIDDLDKHHKPNFLVVGRETSVAEIKEVFRSFLSREDISIILISQCLADLIQHTMKAHHQPLPTVDKIPCKEHPYDLRKDSVLQHTRGLFAPKDLH